MALEKWVKLLRLVGRSDKQKCLNLMLPTKYVETELSKVKEQYSYKEELVLSINEVTAKMRRIFI